MSECDEAIHLIISDYLRLKKLVKNLNKMMLHMLRMMSCEIESVPLLCFQLNPIIKFISHRCHNSCSPDGRDIRFTERINVSQAPLTMGDVMMKQG